MLPILETLDVRVRHGIIAKFRKVVDTDPLEGLVALNQCKVPLIHKRNLSRREVLLIL